MYVCSLVCLCVFVCLYACVHEYLCACMHATVRMYVCVCLCDANLWQLLISSLQQFNRLLKEHVNLTLLCTTGQVQVV